MKVKEFINELSQVKKGEQLTDEQGEKIHKLIPRLSSMSKVTIQNFLSKSDFGNEHDYNLSKEIVSCIKIDTMFSSVMGNPGATINLDKKI